MILKNCILKAFTNNYKKILMCLWNLLIKNMRIKLQTNKPLLGVMVVIQSRNLKNLM